ncbi:MAG: hypothetical protein KDE27_14185 [Planctomycetes bacterium]|nr:hypothetical protein [Planctomycetota bacterium]
MEHVYFYCAVIGGAFLVLQVLLMLLAGGHSGLDVDASPDVDVTHGDVGHPDASAVVVQLSFKTVVAFVTFFGLTGMACLQNDVDRSATLLAAFGAGLFAFFMVGYLMSLMMSLQSKGNLDLQSAIGKTAKVDLRIPANHSGAGKVLVVVGGRMKSQKAVTRGVAIPTGAEVTIDGMSAPDTYEVSTL